MPHINIKFFPVSVDEELLKTELTELISRHFGARGEVISIALEPILAEQWETEVYIPEIQEKEELLIKKPNY